MCLPPPILIQAFLLTVEKSMRTEKGQLLSRHELRPEQRPWRRRAATFNQRALPWLLILPAVLLVFVVTFLPITQAINLSFHKTNYLALGQFIGLENYLRFFRDPLGRQSLVNSLVFTFGSLALSMSLAIGLALLLNRSFPGRAVFRTLLILPWVVSQLLAALIWGWLDNPRIGALGYLLNLVSQDNIDLLGNPDTAMIGLIITSVWRTFPYAMILTLAALQTIAPELYEAGKIDGANARQLFMHVTFPLIRNTVLIATIILSISFFNMVEIPLVLTNGGPLNRTELIGLRVYREAFTLFQFGSGSAIALIMFLVNMLVSLLYIRVLRAERTY